MKDIVLAAVVDGIDNVASRLKLTVLFGNWVRICCGEAQCQTG